MENVNDGKRRPWPTLPQQETCDVLARKLLTTASSLFRASTIVLPSLSRMTDVLPFGEPSGLCLRDLGTAIATVTWSLHFCPCLLPCYV